MNLCQWPLLHKGHFCYPKEEDTFTCFNPSTHPRVTVLGWWGEGEGTRCTGTPNCWEKQILPRIFYSMRVAKVVPVVCFFEAYLTKFHKIWHVYLPRLGYISWKKTKPKILRLANVMKRGIRKILK